jgi:hypothetical protein
MSIFVATTTLEIEILVDMPSQQWGIEDQSGPAAIEKEQEPQEAV